MDTKREYKTRSGMTARFIGKDEHSEQYPYVFAVETYDGKEMLHWFSAKGKCRNHQTLLQLIETTNPCIRYVNIFEPIQYYQTYEDARARPRAKYAKTVKLTYVDNILTECELIK